jgi:hypothetical protein
LSHFFPFDYFPHNYPPNASGVCRSVIASVSRPIFDSSVCRRLGIHIGRCDDICLFPALGSLARGRID